MKTKKIIDRRVDRTGQLRFHILPIDSESGFQDLVEFVRQEYGGDFGDPEFGPGSIVQKGKIEGETMVFVLSDSSGAQFYQERRSDSALAERIADAVEARVREIMQ
jgi:hypothetical protein